MAQYLSDRIVDTPDYFFIYPGDPMQSFDQIMQEAHELQERAEFVPALHQFAKAAQLDPTRKEPLTELAMLYYEKGDIGGSIGFLLNALKCDPDDAFIRLNLGLQLYEHGQPEAAVEHLKESVLLIQRFVAGTRIDAMFTDGEDMETLLRHATELENTGEQTIKLLREIASDGLSNSSDDAEGANQEADFALSSQREVA